MKEAALRQRARVAIESGGIPNRAPDRTWGGPGVGASCSICELPVLKQEMEFEIQFARKEHDRGSGDPHFAVHHVHVRCFAVWELERTRPIRTLVVEDDADSREMLCALLELEEQEVDGVVNGLKALELLAQRSYDLILIDLRMPGMSGEELYCRIALDWPHLVPRIVFVSATEPSLAFQKQYRDAPVPLLKKPISWPAIQQVVAAVMAQKTTPMADIKPLISIVDDDLSVRRALSRLVRFAGYAVESFGTAREFLASDARGRTACLVLDIRLDRGEMSGFDLQDRLVADGVAIPIIFMTAHADASTRERVKQAGVAGFLAKPFVDHALLDLIRKETGPA
jgi:FixJ family two-component response regulator